MSNFTPETKAPSVTPVSETITSPEAKFLHVVFALRVLHAHAGGALDLLFRVEDETALHLAADAAQSARRQHAFGRAADAEIEIDPGLFRLRGEDDAGDIAVGNDAQRAADAAAILDDRLMPRRDRAPAPKSHAD